MISEAELQKKPIGNEQITNFDYKIKERATRFVTLLIQKITKLNNFKDNRDREQNDYKTGMWCA